MHLLRSEFTFLMDCSALIFCKLGCTWCMFFKITCTRFVYWWDLKYLENTHTQYCGLDTFLSHSWFHVLLNLISILSIVGYWTASWFLIIKNILDPKPKKSLYKYFEISPFSFYLTHFIQMTSSIVKCKNDLIIIKLYV